MADPPTLYDRDFFAWTPDQAAALRRAQRDRIDAPLDWWPENRHALGTLTALRPD